MMRSGIKGRIVIPVIAVIVVVVAVILVYTSVVFTNFNEETIDNKLEMLSNSINDYLSNAEQYVSSAGLTLAASSDFVAVLQSGDTNEILDFLAPYIGKLNVSYFTIADHEGTVLARTFDPASFGDVTQARSIQSALAGLTTTNFGAAGVLRVTCHSGTPVYDADGNLIGAISAGIRFDMDETVDGLKNLLNAEVTLFADDERINTTVMQDGSRIVGTKMSQEVYERVVGEKMEFTGTASVLGEPFAAIYKPLLNASGDPFATLFVGISRTSLLETGNTMLRNSIIIGVAGLVIAIFIVLFIADKISKPLIVLSNFMQKASTTGDITVTPEQERLMANYMNDRDEIGRAMAHSGAFIDHVIELTGELDIIAKGDLTHEINLLSDADTMGKSLKIMVDSLNKMFNEINSVTGQVSAGSQQIADGAQSLAQGSTEQAASIEELSSSIIEIAEQTKANAATAERTASLSDSIKESAEKGSRQMDEMIKAVSDINEASMGISKIIKTIDDIAFQTNILALNAAVEAARAGQHGKGFAVVAEEVRNLASKSAAAAKDTGNMIQNSMEKAELGSRIANETASSLTEIVTGINESSNLISEIASASEAQSKGISQINIGIDQVAQVVQQNSATAQESAAASQEMSGQSDNLQNLVAEFKLKKSSDYVHRLPPHTAN